MENHLLHLAEFRQLLDNYQISDSGKELLQKMKLVLMVAPSAGGRNTIIEELLKSDQYHFMISDTTRLPRVNDGVLEQDGLEYWFRSEEEMLQELRRGELLEAEIIHNQQISGISLRELRKAQADQKIAITDVDIEGVNNIMQAKADTIAIIMLPPNFEVWQQRVHSRGKITDTEYVRRMQTAIRIFESALKFTDQYKFVINDTIEHAVSQVNKIVYTGTVDPIIQEQTAPLVEQLLNETQLAVKKLS